MNHFIDDENYAALIEFWNDNSGVHVHDAVRALADLGAIFPKAIEDRIEGRVPPVEPVKFLEGGGPTPAPDFISLYEDILPSISEALDELVEHYGVRPRAA